MVSTRLNFPAVFLPISAACGDSACNPMQRHQMGNQSSRCIWPFWHRTAHRSTPPDLEPSSSANRAVVPSPAPSARARRRNAASVASTARRAACCRAASAASGAASAAAGIRLRASGTQAVAGGLLREHQSAGIAHAILIATPNSLRSFHLTSWRPKTCIAVYCAAVRLPECRRDLFCQPLVHLLQRELHCCAALVPIIHSGIAARSAANVDPLRLHCRRQCCLPGLSIASIAVVHRFTLHSIALRL